MMAPVADEVTSPWGFRTHPVYGTQKLHDGIDFGADIGTPVHAAADGVIVCDTEVSGYGNYIEIDHGNGIHTFYAHLNSFASSPGQAVRQGDVIAYSGNTGIGTGAHLHFGLHIGAGGSILSGEPANPADYLDGSIAIPDTPAIGVDGNFYRSDFDEFNIDFDSYYDFAKPLRDAINEVSKQCTKGLKLVQEDIKWLFFALVTIDLALSATFNLLEGEWEPISWLARRFIKYGFVLFLIVHWGDMVANGVRDYFVSAGGLAAGATVDINGDLGTPAQVAGMALSDPTFIVQKGAHIISPIFTYLTNYSGIKIMFGGFAVVVIAVILAFTILACYFIIGLQIMMAYLEFYIIASLSVVTLGFSGLKQTKFLAEKGIGALIAVSLKLMIFSFLAVFMSEIVKDYEGIPYDFFNYLKILLVSLLFVFLGSRVTGTAGKL
jgi:P-type conjugative transfer protein TrbL